jgi:predicted RNA binding protein YcfA (HicA-like mRNA interferase family)
VPKIPGVNHLRAIQALEKAGFNVIRQGKHVCDEPVNGIAVTL